MEYEWYSGSDTTQEIPRRLSRLHGKENDWPLDKRIEELKQLLAEEGDTNWKAYLYYCIAQELRQADQKDEGLHFFEQAFDTFDTLARNFEGVVEQYCRTAYHLVTDCYIDSGKPDMAAAVGLAALSWLDCAGFDEFEASMFLSALGTAFNLLGNRDGEPWLYQAALGFKLRAHHLEPEDPGRIQGVIYSLYNVDRRQDCLRAFEMFQQVAEGFELKDEVERFVLERVAEDTQPS
jgi:tetratricopeptide (TPR) repeat protein